MDVTALFLQKLQYFSRSVRFYHCSCRITESSLISSLALEHLKHSGTQTFRVLRHLGTQAFVQLGHSDIQSTWTLGHLGTQGTLFTILSKGHLVL